MEVEIALLAGVLGFFLGGLINVRKEIIDIVFAAVVTGVLVFFITYFAMTLVFSGKNGAGRGEESDFRTDNFNSVKAAKQKPAALQERPVRVQSSLLKGKKLDVVSKDDTLFDDIYKK